MSYDRVSTLDSAAFAAPEAAKRAKTGGRRKGTPNKTTSALRDAVLEAFAQLQDEAGGNNGHFVDWARDNPTEFYRLSMRLLPRGVIIPDSAEPITEIRRIIVRPPSQP